MALFDASVLSQRLCESWVHHPILNSHVHPPRDKLAAVLEAAYSASMQVEEGRPLKFGLVLWTRDDGDEPEYEIARFGQPRQLSGSEIRRLAPAIGSSSVFLAVDVTNGCPVIWGALDVGSEWLLFERAEETSGRGLPFRLAISITAPGTMSLRFGDFPLCRIEGGQAAQRNVNVLKSGPVHQFFRPAMQRLLERAFPNREELLSDAFFFISYGGEYLRFLVRTLRYAEEFGHGGALIVVREEDEPRVSDLVSIKYSVTNWSMWEELAQFVQSVFKEIELSKLSDGELQVEREVHDAWRAAIRERQKLSRRLVDRSRFLARLTQVDGALLVTDRLQPIGFGAIIKNLSDAPPTVRCCEDELCETVVDIKCESYGTRHRSAIQLCRQIDCTAFVLSQDGGVKVCRKRNAEVLLWPQVSLSPSAWFPTAEDVIPELK